ncbi:MULTISPECIES: hypothetical protein [unclassified Acidovorax]|uniref:hypothetical protein n=1 Tax=unclassified Acidovorax TaxID=2684926 RepID=UPI001C48742D|nr:MULTISPECIES: hypothetical protein [unclassified Acidovorax]MBV7428089.1 hypothetical protein [Acidovorax sp. sif0732]MBV7449346.1 hypothetical protein [Acidovorax sp. sif0715]
MSAVAERPAKKKVIRERAPTDPVTTISTVNAESAIKLAFGQIEALLCAAHMTEENHEWSGDSCRLLHIAHGLAAQASENPLAGHDLEEAAFNIAALIRAARLVPGDSESPERKVLVDQATVHLNWLTESDAAGQDCCDPGVPRPAAPAVPGATAPSDEVGYRELARQANYEISKLADALQTLTLHEGTEEHPITFGIAARVSMLAEVVFHAAELHGTTREEIGSPELAELQRRFKGGL